MLLLASTSDEIRLVTSDAANVDVSASWADNSSGTVSLNSDVTLITTATTTTVVSSPGSGVYRAITTLVIRNRSSLQPTRVTVVHRASGPVDAELMSALLQPGDSIVYDEHDCFRYIRGPYGNLASSHERVWLDPNVGALYTQILPASVARGSATANRLTDVPDLQFSVREGQRYWFHYALMYTSAATTTGSRWSIYGPGSVTALRYVMENSLTTTSKTSTEGHAAYDLPAASNATSATTGANLAFIEGFIDTPTCDGIVFPRFASEVANSNITLLKGSRCEWQRMT